MRRRVTPNLYMAPASTGAPNGVAVGFPSRSARRRPVMPSVEAVEKLISRRIRRHNTLIRLVGKFRTPARIAFFYSLVGASRGPEM